MIIMAKKVTVNKDLCIGCGACAATAPSVFAIADDGKADVIVPEVGDADEGACSDAAANCPAAAIEIA